MGRKVLFINLLLLAAVTVFAQQLVSAWKGFESHRNLQSIIGGGDSRAVGDSEAEPSPGEVGGTLALPDYLVIAERDLFSPDRRPAPEDGDESGADKAPQFPKRPEMTGVSIIDGESIAYVTVYDSPKAAGETRQYKVGSDLQGYLVTEITESNLTAQWNDVVEVIEKGDAQQPQKPAQAGRQLAAINIIRIGSKMAAVETSSPSEPQQGEAQGGQGPRPAPGGTTVAPGRTVSGAERAVPRGSARSLGAAGRRNVPPGVDPSTGLPGLIGVPGFTAPAQQGPPQQQ